MYLQSHRRITGVKAKLLKRVQALHPALANDISDLKLPWYYIRNAVTPEPDKEEEGDESYAEIFIYDEIGGSFGVDANEFIQDLQSITAENITVRINSPGGNVIDSIAIYNSLIQHKAFITTRVDSMAASAASIIAMAGDKVEMMVGSQLMIHDAMAAEMGNARELREAADWLDMQSENLATIYAAKGGTIQDWRALMLAETWMFANEAVEIGLADSVYERAVRRELESAGIDPTQDETPGPEEEEPPSEEPDEDEMPMMDDEEAEAIAILMNKKHVLTNRGYKYAGREKAPKPRATRVSNSKSKRDQQASMTHAEFVAALLGS